MSKFGRFFFFFFLILLLLVCFSYVRLCNPIDGSPPGSSLPGILQARILEWVAISFSNACRHAKSLQSWLCATPWTAAHQAPLAIGFSREEYWSGLPFPSPRDSVGLIYSFNRQAWFHGANLAPHTLLGRGTSTESHSMSSFSGGEKHTDVTPWTLWSVQ